MAVISNATEAWSAAVVLEADELWQVVEGGAARLTHEASPNIQDGAYVPLYQGVVFPSGTSVKYRKATAVPTIITRTRVR